jgi:hypothetical protein
MNGAALVLDAESGAPMGPIVSESVKVHGMPTLTPWV